MNIYFLVEGRRTERKVYPRWLSVLLPQLAEIRFPHDAIQNSFYIFSGNGYPSIMDHLKNSFAEVNEIGNYDFLVMCVDAEEAEVLEREKEIFDYIEENKLHSKTTEFKLIIQNRCIETWFLGNPKIFKQNPESERLREYISFYNVRTHDPEQMGNNGDFETHAQFHQDYLIELLKERNIRYSKKNPQEVIEEYYLSELIKRSKETLHIPTFQDFIDFCSMVRKELKPE